MNPATKDSWKRLPLPNLREQLSFPGFYTDARAENIQAGHIPEDMDDKWFIYSEKGWVYFHRSWTGACIFALKLDGSPAGVRVSDSWVSREEKEYSSKDIEQDRKLLTGLIGRYFPDEK